MGKINLTQKIVGFNDVGTAVPVMKFWDWTKSTVNLSATNPRLDNYSVAPSASLTVFDGSVTTSMDGTTVFSVSKNSAKSNTYRFTYTSGTAPVFKTNRNLALNTSTVTLTVNNDGTATFSTTGTLAALQVGDYLFIPGLSTGDAAGPFSTSNEGIWIVMTTGTTSIIISRPIPASFSGVNDSVSITANSQVVGFANDKVQIGYQVDILGGGFSTFTVGSYTITNVTPTFFEVGSLDIIPAQTGVTPGTANMSFYTSMKKWVRVEADQEAALQFNGDTTLNTRLSPLVIQDGTFFSYMEKLGSAYSLTVVNRSPSVMNLSVWSVE